VLQHVPQLRSFRTLHLQQPRFMKHEIQGFWRPPVSFLLRAIHAPFSFIFCEITFYPAHFFSHPHALLKIRSAHSPKFCHPNNVR